MKTRTWMIDVQVVEIRRVTVTVDDQFADMLAAAYEDAENTIKYHGGGELRSRTVTFVPGSHDLIREVIEPDDLED